MRVPVAWLREYCSPDLSTAEIAERLDLTGTEVARVERVGVGDPDGFVVGRVLEAEQHPDADRLTVCKVDVGTGDPETIVCGAPNVAAGQVVAVARPGAAMPDGTKLGKAKLRGVESSGMILAEDEVGISDEHAETMVLDGDLTPGEPLAPHLPIADDVIELEITTNRPDCLAVYGIARELHAATGAPLAPDPTDEDAQPTSDQRPATDHVSIEIADPDICLRFTGRVFEEVKVGPSPLWLKQRLTAAGQRPISNVVDITNYVMLLTGQPVHAFDLDEVRGDRIVVRRAKPGETMTTLDDVERELDPDMAMVCDAEGPSGIAGVMGGQISEVSGETTRVLMEMATWVGPNILETSRRLALRSEASARFEKQLHPDQAIAAQRLAARLMVELCGARMAPGTIDVYPELVPTPRPTLRAARMERLLGQAIPVDESAAILARLGFDVAAPGEEMEVGVPAFRASDVRREVDLIEEVARIHGLDELPVTLPAREGTVGSLTPAQRLRRRAEDALRDRGLYEIVAWSFTAPETFERLRMGDLPLLRLSNPLSEDQSVMRPLLLPGLLDVARRNAAYDRAGAAYFESAHVYRMAGPLEQPEGSPEGRLPAAERHHIAALVPGDFFAAKGMLEGLLGTIRVPFSVEAGERPFLHPGRAASVLAADESKIGWIGELHPLVAREWDLPGGAGFELDFDALAELADDAPGYTPVSTFPAVIQDIAVVVADDVPAADVEDAVRAGGGELLERLRLFDVYRGEQVGEGKKSLALRLEFRAPDRTLTDEEVAEVRTRIESGLAELGGRLRG